MFVWINFLLFCLSHSFLRTFPTPFSAVSWVFDKMVYLFGTISWFPANASNNDLKFVDRQAANIGNFVLWVWYRNDFPSFLFWPKTFCWSIVGVNLYWQIMSSWIMEFTFFVRSWTKLFEFFRKVYKIDFNSLLSVKRNVFKYFLEQNLTSKFFILRIKRHIKKSQVWNTVWKQKTQLTSCMLKHSTNTIKSPKIYFCKSFAVILIK